MVTDAKGGSPGTKSSFSHEATNKDTAKKATDNSLKFFNLNVMYLMGC
jgi:hypothetical protein